MKDKRAYVEFNIVKDKDSNDSELVKVYVDDLRKYLNKAKEQGAEGIEFQFKTSTSKKTLNVQFTNSELKKLIKTAELSKPFVPRYLSQYLVDLTQQIAASSKEPIVGRDAEIEKAWFYISQKSRNNVFLIGDKDVGKTAIAKEIARQVARGEAPKEFFDSRVILLRPEVILKIENERIYNYMIKRIMNFLVENKDNLILYIDKSIYMKTDSMLIIMLHKFIINYNIPIITTASVEDYDDYFEDDPILAKYVNCIYVEEPELDELRPMIINHIEKLSKQYKISISDEIIKFGIFTSNLNESISCNPGNVINIFERAFLEAKRKEKKEVDKKCILSCYNSYIKLYSKMSNEDKKGVAYHETGHYIARIMSKNIKDLNIACVSILPMMDFLGVNSFYMELGKNISYTKKYLFDRIVMLMAGRVGESRFTKEFSTGASSDLEMANNIARALVLSYGLSDNDSNKNRCYDMTDFYLMSNEKKKELDEEIQGIINEAYQKAEEIINENAGLLKSIAEKLMKEEILTGEELTKICENYRKGRERRQRSKKPATSSEEDQTKE